MNNNNASAQTTLECNQWTHVAGTLDGATGTLSLYTNGVLAAQTVTSLRPFGESDPNQSPGGSAGSTATFSVAAGGLE